MKTLAESLFDKDLISDDITTLYELFGRHIKKYQHTYGEGLGWTHFFNQTEVVREWKKEGRPALSGGFARTTFPPDLQKFIAVILNNSVITKKQLINLPSDGNLDDTSLNNELESKGILADEGSMWGASNGRYNIRVQLGYIKSTFTSDHGIKINLQQVGTKRFKGKNTENIEISIYAYDPKYPGRGCHIWTLLTDISINDIK